ncbi:MULTISPECIES: carbohydrate ABC transporter permease [Arthrobacter]|uniref:Sugar ABC transporter permease n=1 Tax=Arthrobacter terricola TaxID=2547396 RepID=A0A4R5KB49_9MICC|nr:MULTISPECIES: sugar ABC transporter permease [Arthrobacter]MBT8162268.1 sugar ABC transporter permease [Arthrobacter sp. GN70]TDF92256.1 sugar ABC transporter permease [Arthrobacter terricola]
MNLSSTNVHRPGTIRSSAGPRSTRPKAPAVRARKLVPFAFVSPTLALITLLTVVPILMVAGYSFMDNVIVEPNPVFVGFANYVKVLSDPTFLTALGNTFVFITLSTVVHLVLGLAFALLLNTPLLGNVTKAIFRVIYILPWLFTIAVIAIVWRLMLDPSGVVNYLLGTFGIQGADWLSTPETALGSVTFINIWSGYPFFMISLLAALQGVPTVLHEAARVDGAGWWQRFLYVTLPHIRPVIISMAVLDLIWTSQQFALIWMTTGGGPLNATEVVSTYTYKQAFSNFDFSTASAAAVIVLLLTMALAFFYVRQQKVRD